MYSASAKDIEYLTHYAIKYVTACASMANTEVNAFTQAERGLTRLLTNLRADSYIRGYLQTCVLTAIYEATYKLAC